MSASVKKGTGGCVSNARHICFFAFCLVGDCTPIFRLFRRTFWGRSQGAAFRALSWVGLAGAALLYFSANGQAQAALLLEQPYGVFGALNPTGHAALYLEHV